MNTPITSKAVQTMIGFLFVLLVALALTSCTDKTRAMEPSCRVDMDQRVTINVTDAKPQVVFDQLASDPECAIKVSPFVTKHVTLNVQGATVSEVLAIMSAQTDSKYTYDGQRLVISRLNIFDKRNRQAQEEWQQKFKVYMPEGLVFEEATVSSVLAEISEISGLKITPWPGEGNRKVTLDLSGMTVDEALKAVVIQIDGDGAVLVTTWTGGTAEHRLVD